MDFINELKWRGLIHQCSDEERLVNRIGSGTITAYIGFDPTAPSLHVGSLLQVLTLQRLQRAGHRPIAIVGGATGLIGDPSGKSDERQLLTRERITINLAGIRKQLERFLDFSEGPTQPMVLDNSAWLDDVRLIDFLRDVGKHFSINEMTKRDSVRTRLENRDQGISFTEFSYMLLQAYDFLVLYDRYNCILQIGGSDQWGNALQGADLIRRLRGGTAFVLTAPLITTADGRKFGKTESSAIWLDAEQTSGYRFYQFWLNTDDRDVINYLKYFTFLPSEQIAELHECVRTHPEKREAQKILAGEITRLVHGGSALLRAQKATDVLFGRGTVSELSEKELLEAFQAVPFTRLDSSMIKSLQLRCIDLLVTSGIEPSKAQAARDLAHGALSANGSLLTSEDGPRIIDCKWLLHGQYVVFRRGKKDYALVHFT